mmetsp:Transcript_12158/g.22953  ORF Transcript_12158/g.22953 Transcript_12158/m.22953 type:complete len:401 (-) Transcript_12158:118-1320(-)
MAGGGGGLGGTSIADAALEAWRACDPNGYVLGLAKLRDALPKIAENIPCRPLQAPELGRLFVEDEGPPIFVQMLRPQAGKVHFLYFWKAFGEAARIGDALAIEHDSLSIELEMLRDRALRLMEEAKEALATETGCGCKDEAPQVEELPLVSLLSEVHRAAAMSAYPQFWSRAVESLPTEQENDSLSLVQITCLLLSWLQDAALFEHRGQRPERKEERKEETGSDSMRSMRGARGMPVFLNVYDVSQEEGIQKLNRVLAHKSSPVKLGGVFHAGVEVDGLEWCFGFSASETHPGVACVEPRTHPQHHFRQTVDMGCTHCTKEEVADIVSHLLEEYPGCDYDLLRRNCCHFCDDFTRRLGLGGIPGWVMRLARIGAGVEWMLQSAPRPIKQRLGFLAEEDSD